MNIQRSGSQPSNKGPAEWSTPTPNAQRLTLNAVAMFSVRRLLR